MSVSFAMSSPATFSASAPGRGVVTRGRGVTVARASPLVSGARCQVVQRSFRGVGKRDSRSLRVDVVRDSSVDFSMDEDTRDAPFVTEFDANAAEELRQRIAVRFFHTSARRGAAPLLVGKKT